MNKNDSESQGAFDYSVKAAIVVRGLRNMFAISQDEMDLFHGVSRPTLSKIEGLNNKSVKADTLEKILRLYKSKGVELSIKDEEVTIKLTPTALQEAYVSINTENERKKKVKDELERRKKIKQSYCEEEERD